MLFGKDVKTIKPHYDWCCDAAFLFAESIIVATTVQAML